MRKARMKAVRKLEARAEGRTQRALQGLVGALRRNDSGRGGSALRRAVVATRKPAHARLRAAH